MATSLLNQDSTYIRWLDTHSGSVLYVSFGSVIRVTKDEFTEVAWGLANSGKPFLWVVRRGLVLGVEEPQELPEGFESAVEGRGKVIEWAPQQEVLAHPAVGGFWTQRMELHVGGRVSTRGCRCYPGLSWRSASDWKVRGGCVEGWGFAGGCARARGHREGDRKLMGEQEGIGMRERAMNLKEKARMCLESSGSSQQAVDKLVDHILSL